jgi:hypothetical protein
MAYATATDIETRLKPTLGRDLTADETAAAELLCEGATGVIVECHGGDEITDSPPRLLRIVAIEVVRRAMANPNGLQSEQETLGSYSHAQRFLADGNLELKGVEERMVRGAVHGRLSGTSQMHSLVSEECGS